MNKSVKDIAELLNGEIKGDSTKIITGVAGLAEAKSSDISFLKTEKDQHALKLYEKTKAGAIIVPISFSLLGEENSKTVIRVGHTLSAYSTILALISSEKTKRIPRIHSSASIAPTAKIGANVSIGPFCIVEEDAVLEDNVWLHGQNYIGARTKVGRGTILYPQVVIREDIRIGNDCIFHPGCVIGSDGYGFFFKDGKHNKIPQVGTVEIEDEVEIGASSTVDRATTGSTIIRKGTKIDNLVQVAHNVEIGEGTLLAAQVGIAGSCKIGKGVVFGGQSGVADHIIVADGTQVGGQGGITQDTNPNSILWGTPAHSIQDELKETLLVRKLPELFKDVKKLKERLKDNV